MNEKKLTDLLRFPAAETGGRPPDADQGEWRHVVAVIWEIPV